jgi:hypothetical protein
MVARQALISARARLSMTLSNQPKSNSPGLGSTSAQAKMPTLTMDTPASRIRATSSVHTSSGHCSGL